MGLTLYTARFDSVPVIGCSPPSWAVWLACLEKGVEFEHHELDFEKGEHKAPAFLAKNPKGTLPALFDHDRLVSDTRAMLQCIERQHGAKLLGETQELRAAGTRQLSLANELKDAGMTWLAALMKDQSEAAELRPAYEEQLKKLADTFGEGTYMAPADEAGTQPGLADLLSYAYVATSLQMGLSIDDWPKMDLWLRAMESRDSVQRTRPAAWASSSINEVG